LTDDEFRPSRLEIARAEARTQHMCRDLTRQLIRAIAGVPVDGVLVPVDQAIGDDWIRELCKRYHLSCNRIGTVYRVSIPTNPKSK